MPISIDIAHEHTPVTPRRRRVFALGVALMTLPLGCGDDPEPSLRCREDVLERRIGQVWTMEQDCAAEGNVCTDDNDGVPACVAPPCRTGEKTCEGEVLRVCADGDWQTEQDCSSLGQHCVPFFGGLPRCTSEVP